MNDEQEEARIAELLSKDILDTPPEDRFDRITKIASDLFEVPICLVSLVDRDRQWFKSRQGLDATETPRDIAFCAHAIKGESVFLVPDATKDDRFKTNPLVTSGPLIQFYAGAPLITDNGHKLGTLCIIDTEPRRLDEKQQQLLSELAAITSEAIQNRQEQKELRYKSRELENALGRVDAIVNTVVDGIITIDSQGIVDAFNHAAEKLFLYKADQVIGKNVKMLMPNHFAVDHDQYIESYLETGKSKVIGLGREVVGRRSDGSEFPMELAISEMKVDGKTMFTGILRDITERAETDRIKQQFVSTVSHELRTPLSSIRGALGMMSTGALGQLPQKVQHMLELAERNTVRLIALVNDLLDVEQLQAGKMSFDRDTCDLVGIVSRSIEAVGPFAQQTQVEISFDGPDMMCGIYADESRILQVMSNLLSNAIKFSPREGLIKVGVESQGQAYRVSVNDQGPGIRDEFKSRIFQRFAQADSSDSREKGGTGLGLNISKSIIENHGGTIGFVSSQGVGSTFYFELPKMDKELKRSDRLMAEKLDETHVANGPTHQVLLIEDDQDYAEVLIGILSDTAQVHYAPTLVAGKLAITDKAYDLIIIDIGLPDGSGLQLLDPLKEFRRKGGLVFILSADPVSNSVAQLVDLAIVKGQISNDDIALAVTDRLSNK